MKKILLFSVCLLGLMSAMSVSGQTFSVPSDPSDTVWMTVNGSTTVPSPITNLTANTFNLKWHVIATNWPADWLTETAFSICDDQYCRSNTSNELWNSSTSYGPFYYAPYGGNSTHDSSSDFHLLLNFTSVTSSGTYYLSVSMQDTTNGGTSKVVTFMINRYPTAITNVNNTENDIVLYPNPTHDEVNLIYDPSNDVKSIVVYNIIGKALSVYKVTNNSSANLNLENIPSGIYFVRLFNSHGDVVVTRKFTKQ